MADMTGLRRAVSQRVEEIASTALDLTERDTIDAAPERTGALKQLIGTTGPSMVGDFVAQCEIYCDAAYAGYTDAGTEEHDIPGNPLLAFYWENGPDGAGDYVFAKVHHPGTTGTQWFNSGQDGGEPMQSRWRRALEQAAR